jgi:hypothetical protein
MKGRFNDLWRYSNETWTWISGDSSTNVFGVYGSQGMAASSSVPGSRSDAVGWIDSSGSLWLFGGAGYAAASVGKI